MRRLPVGTELRPLVVSAIATHSVVTGNWYVDVETMPKIEARARGICDRNAVTSVSCRSEAQARKLSKLLTEATCDDGPEPAEEDDEP